MNTLETLEDPFRTYYYLEYANGDCSIVRSDDDPESLRTRENAKSIRFATEDDIQYFRSMGGSIR